MRVSLRPLANPASGAVARGAAPRPLLDPAGPICVLGSRADEDALSAPVAPSPQTMFGPRGAALAGADGPLFVTDTGHHRLLIWLRSPEADHTPADLLIGQPDFFREGRNAKGEPGAATLNVPTGVAASGDVLAVADAWNHRVLIWRGLPRESNRPADVVLGQADFAATLANRGGEVGPHTLNWCYGVSIADGRLIVCDTGNRRVLVWDDIPRSQWRAGRSRARPDLHGLPRREWRTRRSTPAACAGRTRRRWLKGALSWPTRATTG